jgi:nucleosome assembly protein 1-like 1
VKDSVSDSGEQEYRRSFFNFFSPPEIPNSEENEVDIEVQDELEKDFEIENQLRECIIPKAVLFFTGEALQDGDEGDEDDDDDELEEEECDDEEDPDWDPSQLEKQKNGQPECKQQ